MEDSMQIFLNNKIREYVQIGNNLGLFDLFDVREIYDKVKDVEIQEDNNIPGNAVILTEDGKSIIKVNQEKCSKQGQYFLDEIVFNELTHFTNEIHQDLYGDRKHRIMTFKKCYAEYATNNQLIKYPEWGAILLDDAICQKVAQTMVESKYGKRIYTSRKYKSDILDSNIILTSDFADCPEYEKLANIFAETIVGKEGLLGFSKILMRKEGIDRIFSKYLKKEYGINKLYKILGYMGNVAIADYASKGHFVLKDSEENRKKENVLKSMQKATWMMEELKNKRNKL